jgi:hypothetical protein
MAMRPTGVVIVYLTLADAGPGNADGTLVLTCHPDDSIARCYSFVSRVAHIADKQFCWSGSSEMQQIKLKSNRIIIHIELNGLLCGGAASLICLLQLLPRIWNLPTLRGGLFFVRRIDTLINIVLRLLPLVVTHASFSFLK